MVLIRNPKPYISKKGNLMIRGIINKGEVDLNRDQDIAYCILTEEMIVAHLMHRDGDITDNNQLKRMIMSRNWRTTQNLQNKIKQIRDTVISRIKSKIE